MNRLKPTRSLAARTMGLCLLASLLHASGCGGGGSSGSGGAGGFGGNTSDPATSQVSLTWDKPTTNEDGSPLTDLAGYRVYEGTEPGVYTAVTRVKANEFTSIALPEGVYYFTVTAYDTAGNESAFSEELAISLPRDADLRAVH